MCYDIPKHKRRGETMFFSSILFSTYGRAVKSTGWKPDMRAGINRLYYIHSGSITCSMGRDEITLTPGNIYLLPHNLDYKLSSEYVDHTYFDFFSVPSIHIDNILAIQADKYPLLQSAITTLYIIAQDHPMSLIVDRSEFYDVLKSYVDNLIFLINRQFGIKTVIDDIINDSLMYIHKHYFQKISVSELADKYHMEKSAFIRRFKRYTNCTPYSYIKVLRTNIAMQLLKTNNYTLNQVAEMVGYSDSSSLSHSMAKQIKTHQIESYHLD